MLVTGSSCILVSTLTYEITPRRVSPVVPAFSHGPAPHCKHGRQSGEGGGGGDVVYSYSNFLKVFLSNMYSVCIHVL